MVSPLIADRQFELSVDFEFANESEEKGEKDVSVAKYLKFLLKNGKVDGYVTYEEISKALPDQVSSDMIEDAISIILSMIQMIVMIVMIY